MGGRSYIIYIQFSMASVKVKEHRKHGLISLFLPSAAELIDAVSLC